ncbi:MAG: erythromycin esterase family protein [candidate division KSB1 bacterium]
MKLNLLILLSTLFLGLLACQNEQRHAHDPAKVQALRSALVPVRALESDNENFADLEPLKTKWQHARLLLLGEATHGDGATFAAKVRLIKFLHREMGFEVLAFESGMYDCEKAWSLIQSGMPAAKAAHQSLFGLWSESRQVQPVFEYIDTMRESERPLRLTGFDLQFSGKISRDSLLVDLENFLRAASVDTSSWLVVKTTLDTLFRFNSRFRKMTAPRQEDFYNASRRLREGIASAQFDDASQAVHATSNTPLPPSRGELSQQHPEHSPLEGGQGGVSLERINHSQFATSSRANFWLQLLKSTETLLRFSWNANFDKPDPKILNLRDQQMGENLLWLARKRFANKKIIVWAATSHSSRNRQNIRAPNRGAIGESGMVPMGDYVWKELGAQSYVLGFVAHHGRSGVRGRSPWDLAAPRASSLEDWLGHCEYDNAILDWRSLPHEAAWLADTLLARPMGYVPMRARWPEIMDGVMFIREMKPSLAIE